MTTVTVHYFAGARAAAGVEREEVAVPAGTTVAGLTRALAERHGSALARVLAVASCLVDEVAAGPEAALADGARVDVLPPFAGG